MSQGTKIVVGVLLGLFVCSLAVGFVLLAGGSLYLASSASQPSTHYFLTVSEMLAKKDTINNRQVRISGAVIGNTIRIDEANGKLSFFIAEVPSDLAEVEKQGGLAVVLKDAVNDPKRQAIQIIYIGEKPDLLRNMSQAIITGKLNQDGLFYADEILLKCLSRYEAAVPDQAIERP